MKANYLLNVLSEDKKGLVSSITNLLNRKGIEMESICTGKTDIHNQVLINIQLTAEKQEIKMMALKIKNIIEVCQVKAFLLQDSWYQKVALYVLEKEGYNADVYNKIQKYGAVLVGFLNDDLIIQKTGRDEDILALYNALDGKHLKKFSKSAAISFNNLDMDEEAVISLAA